MHWQLNTERKVNCLYMYLSTRSHWSWLYMTLTLFYQWSVLKWGVVHLLSYCDVTIIQIAPEAENCSTPKLWRQGTIWNFGKYVSTSPICINLFNKSWDWYPERLKVTWDYRNKFKKNLISRKFITGAGYSHKIMFYNGAWSGINIMYST